MKTQPKVSRTRTARLAWRALMLGLFVGPLLLIGGADAYIGTAHIHFTKVRHTVFEQFGVTATQTTVEGKYQQNSNPYVNFPQLVWNECYKSSFPTWTVHSCTPAVYKVGSGPTGRIVSQIEGDYSHTLGMSYVMFSDYWGEASEGDTYLCELRRGALPYFWSDHCYAYKDGQQVGDY